jgi:hypothetical protein
MVAAACIPMIWSGVSELNALNNKDPDEKKEKTHVDLQVPGTTTANLGKQAYSIWLQGSAVERMEANGKEPRAEDLPPIEWDISGPAPVTVSQSIQLRVNDYRLAGTFSIEEEGEYQFVTTLPEGVENDYIYNIGDDPTAVFAEVAGEVIQGIGQVIKVAVCGIVGGLAFIIGMVMVIIYGLRWSKSAVNPPLSEA